jgi:peptidoglycan/xylan/chitin deacetylase (PgdA/CDA1 family)
MNLTHGADRRETLRALPVIIKSLKDQGYRFVTIPELIGIATDGNHETTG